MKKIQNFYNTLKGQYSTEKTANILEKFNKFTFKVDKKANKKNIKHIIEKLFNVSIISIKTINVKGKRVKFKNSFGKQNDWKKAIVTLKNGNNINFSEFK